MKRCLKVVLLFPGMKKNEKLEANIITPTTKAADHDLPISGAEVRNIYTIFSRLSFALCFQFWETSLWRARVFQHLL